MEINNQAFIRQRRNLVLASAIMLFFVVGDIKVDKIHFVVGSANIDKSEAILQYFAVVSLYFLFRYRAYCQKNVFATFLSSIKKCYSTTNANFAAHYVKNNLLKIYPDIVETRDLLKSICEQNYVEKLRSRVEDMEEAYNEPRVVNVSVTYPGVNGQHSDESRVYVKYCLNDIHATKNYLKCYYQTITMNSFFSEYVLPYLLFWLSFALYVNKIYR